MREILFRGKLTANGEWAYGNLAIKTNGVSIITPDDTPLGKYGQVIAETVGQYTGLTDKNGKKIFEGDIVEFDNDKTGYVVYDEHETEYGIVYDENIYCGLGRVYIDKALEVVGNIHDNSDYTDCMTTGNLLRERAGRNEQE